MVRAWSRRYWSSLMREYVTMECSECKQRNYRTSLETREGKKLSMKKFCRFCGRHTLHNSRKK